MHEVALVEGIVQLVAEAAGTQQFASVRVIRLRLGALGPAEPDALRFCFDAVARGTIAEGARLEIETVPGLGWCSTCACAVGLSDRYDACPACGEVPLRLLAGDELNLSELEVD